MSSIIYVTFMLPCPTGISFQGDCQKIEVWLEFFGGESVVARIKILAANALQKL